MWKKPANIHVKNFLFYNNVLISPIVDDTSKTAKINFINSVAVDTIRSAYYIRGLELMQFIFAFLDVSLTVGLTRCYKAKGFFYIYMF